MDDTEERPDGRIGGNRKSERGRPDDPVAEVDGMNFERDLGCTLSSSVLEELSYSSRGFEEEDMRGLAGRRMLTANDIE